MQVPTTKLSHSHCSSDGITDFREHVHYMPECFINCAGATYLKIKTVVYIIVIKWIFVAKMIGKRASIYK